VGRKKSPKENWYRDKKRRDMGEMRGIRKGELLFNGYRVFVWV
jgi:hypothetical protein